MLTGPKKAVLAAKQYFTSLWEINEFEDLRVEEVELSEDEKFWSITLGFNRPADRVEDPLGEVLDAPRYRREYKIFKVDADSYQIKSMKIREV